MPNRYNVGQAAVVDQDNRNMATGAQGVDPMSQEIDALWTAIDTGPLGIQSLPGDIDSLCLGGGEFSVNTEGTSGLIFAWTASRFHNGWQSITVSAGSVSLAASSTNYVELDRNGTVYSNTSSFTAGRYPLYQLTTSTSAITNLNSANAKPLAVLLGPASVTGAMLSTAANQRSADESIASVAATMAFTVIAPVTGTLAEAVFASATAQATSNSNYWAFTVVNKSNGSAAMLDTGADNSTQATGGSALSAYTSRSLTLSGTGANLTCNKNDVLEVTMTMTGTPTTQAEVSFRLGFNFTA